MKREDLEALGLEKDVVQKVMDLHGDDIESKKKKISELEDQVKEKDKTIKEHEGTIDKLGEDLKSAQGNSDDIEKLKKQIDDYKAADKKRKEDEANALKDKQLTDNILEVIGEKQFVNEYTKNSIISQIKTDLAKEENVGKSIKDIFEGMTKDSTDIFKNPQHDKLDIQPNKLGSGSNAEDDAKIRAVMGLPTTK